MSNINLQSLVAGNTLYCSLIETSSSGTVKRLVTANVTGSVIFEPTRAIIPTDAGGMLVPIANRSEVEGMWHLTESAAIASPTEYARG